MSSNDFRQRIADYIRREAQPPDKFEHQPRLYQLARRLAQGQSYDDDVLYAAAWMHDLGVFLGHRPANLEALARWDHIAYVLETGPNILRTLGFPESKIPAVNEAIRTHLPSGQPTAFEGVLLREADMLEQLGAIGILRTVSKVGRDTRFPSHAAAVQALQRAAAELPSRFQLPQAQAEAEQRLAIMKGFLEAAAQEGLDYSKS